jgi:hypothetical protein
MRKVSLPQAHLSFLGLCRVVQREYDTYAEEEQFQPLLHFNCGGHVQYAILGL